jgi:integrase/recombinase XerC
MQNLSFLEDIAHEIGPVETLAQGVTLFETVGMPAHNLSARSHTDYKNDLQDPPANLEERSVMKLSEIDLRNLESYQAEMDRRGYKSSSRNRKTHTIKTFFTFLHRYGITTTDIAARLIPPKIQKREPRFLSQDEYQRLLRAASHNTRDAAIIEVFLQTGIRLSELAKLTTHDVEIPRRITPDPDNTDSIRVRRKGGKANTIPLNYKACRSIASYLKVRRTIPDDGLFVTKFHTPVSPRAIEYMLSKYLTQAGVPNTSVHTLRHTMATHHVARGTDLKTVQETLGHASLEMTTMYVSLAKKAQHKALQEHAL